MDRRQIRKGDIDAAFDAGRRDRPGRLPARRRSSTCRWRRRSCHVVPEAERPADDLLLHAGALLLDGRRRRAPAVPLNKLKFVGGTVGGGFGGKVDTATETVSALARAEVRPAGEVALDARGGVPLLVDARAVAHGDRRRGDEGRLDPRPQDADAARLGRVRALLAVRPDEAQLPPHRRLHDPEPALRRLRRLHEPRADDGDARLRRHVGLVRDRDAHQPRSPRRSASTRSSSG